MQFLHRVPRPPLSDHVAFLWMHEGYAVPHDKERLLPTGSMDLIIDLRPDARGELLALIVGAHSEPGLLDTSGAVSVLGAHFLPGGAFAFLNQSATELHNLDVDLGDIWSPAEASELRESLLVADDPIATLEAALLRRLNRPRNDLVAFAIRQFRGAKSVAAVAQDIGTSQRTFINTFAREVGMTPKLYCRVRRFNRALRMVHGHEDVDWAEVALACGYFDQSHMIRDFRAFADLTPSEYLDLRTDHLNHVPIG